MLASAIGSFIGTQNKMFAEERAATQAAAAKTAEDNKAFLKSIREKMHTEGFKDSLSRAGYFDTLKVQLASFGSEGQTLTDQLATLVGEIEEEDGFAMYGQDNIFKFMMPEKQDSHYDKNWLANLDAYLGTKNGYEALQELRKTPEHYESLVRAIASFGGRYIRKEHANMNKDGAKFGHQILLHKEFGNFGRWDGLRDALWAAGFDDQMENEALSTKKFSPKDKNNAVYFLNANDPSNTSKGTHFIPNEKQRDILLATAKNMRMPVQEVIDEWGTSSQTILNQLKESSSQAEIKEAYKPLFTALELGEWKPHKLDPQSNFSADVREDDLWNMGEVLFGNKGSNASKFNRSDLVGMSKALVFHMIHNPEKAVQLYGPNVATVTRQEALSYVTKLLFGKKEGEVTKEMGLDYINKGVENSESTARKLTELYGRVEKTDLAGNAAIFYNVWDGIFGLKGQGRETSGGFISQIMTKLSINEETGATWKDDFVRRLDNVGGIRTDLGRIEALRTVLAFQMARAFDPSGRLSNMDIEIQLARLGGSSKFQTVEHALAGIQLAIEDIEQKKQYYSLLQNAVKPASGKRWLSKQTQARVDAAVALKTIMDGHAKYQYDNALLPDNSGFSARNVKHNWQLLKIQNRNPVNPGIQNQNISQTQNQTTNQSANSPIWTLPINNQTGGSPNQTQSQVSRMAGDTDTISTTPGQLNKFELRQNGIRYNYINNGQRSFIDIDPNKHPFTINNNIITWG